MRRVLSLALAILLATGGCASYTPSSAPVPDPAAMAARGSAGDVSVAADPWVDPERQKAVFDADFHDRRVLAIHVHASNAGPRRLLVRKSDMVLRLPGGRQLGPASASAVAAKLESSGQVIGWTLAFGLIGFLAASNADDKARAARLQDYRQKEFQDATLGQGAAAQGFVYFIPPRGTAPFEQATLAVRVVDLEDLKSTVVNLPLARLGYRGWTDDDAPPAREQPRRGAVVGAAAPPPAAGAQSDLAALVGNWVGTLTMTRRTLGESNQAHEVDVRIFEEGGGVRWELLVPARDRGRGGSGWVRTGADGVSLSGAYVPEMFSTSGSAGYRPPAGDSGTVPITYLLAPGATGLDGGGVGDDNMVQRLTLRRAR